MLTVKVRPVYSRVSVVGYYRSMTGKKLGGPTILNVPGQNDQWRLVIRGKSLLSQEKMKMKKKKYRPIKNRIYIFLYVYIYFF